MILGKFMSNVNNCCYHNLCMSGFSGSNGGFIESLNQIEIEKNKEELIKPQEEYFSQFPRK